jgi:hypothetical protein
MLPECVNPRSRLKVIGHFTRMNINSEPDRAHGDRPMTRTIRGIARGKFIELDEDLGLAEGRRVELEVGVTHPRKRLPGPPPGRRPEGNRTAAGRLADSWTEEDDRILEEIHQDRKRACYEVND